MANGRLPPRICSGRSGLTRSVRNRTAEAVASARPSRSGQMATTIRGPDCPAIAQAWSHSASGITRCSTETTPPVGEREHLGQGLGPLLRRDRVVGVAEDADGAAAEHGGGELGDVVGRPADVDQPSPGSEGHRGRRGRFAEHRVDHHVHRSARPPRSAGPSESGPVLVRVQHHDLGRSGRPSRPGRCAERQTATTLAASRCLATASATWPTAPLAPSTTTRSPDCSPARQVSDIQAAIAEVPSAATAASETSALIGTRSACRTVHRSARLPSTGRHPGRGREPDPLAGGEVGRGPDDSDALHAGDVRQRLPTEVRRTAGAEQVERNDGRRADLDEVRPAGFRIGVFAQFDGSAVGCSRRGSHDQVAMSG